MVDTWVRIAGLEPPEINPLQGDPVAEAVPLGCVLGHRKRRKAISEVIAVAHNGTKTITGHDFRDGRVAVTKLAGVRRTMTVGVSEKKVSHFQKGVRTLRSQHRPPRIRNAVGRTAAEQRVSGLVLSLMKRRSGRQLQRAIRRYILGRDPSANVGTVRGCVPNSVDIRVMSQGALLKQQRQWSS
jgi:hypothetical protein